MAKFFPAVLVVLACTLCSVQSQEPQCPPPTGTPVFFPDPADCSKYYMCTDITPIHMECPRPLLWDQSISACNHPGAVQCTPGTTTTTEPTTVDGTTTDVPEPETTTPEPESTTHEATTIDLTTWVDETTTHDPTTWWDETTTTDFN